MFAQGRTVHHPTGDGAWRMPSSSHYSRLVCTGRFGQLICFLFFRRGDHDTSRSAAQNALGLSHVVRLLSVVWRRDCYFDDLLVPLRGHAEIVWRNKRIARLAQEGAVLLPHEPGVSLLARDGRLEPKLHDNTRNRAAKCESVLNKIVIPAGGYYLALKRV